LPNEYSDYEPEVTLFIVACNEKDFVDEKIKNSRELDYHAEKLHKFWVTDESDNGTPNLIRKYEGVEVYHFDERSRKIGAMNHVMQFVKTPIVNFSDGNTNLGKESIREIVNLFSEPKVNFVSGEMRIFGKEKDAATDTGEGLYWKYKSTLKKWGTELYSVVGAAGELFSIRTELFRKVEKYTLPDDFIIYLRVAQNGYTIQYDPETYAIEMASMDVKEELKRKIRISARGIQSVVRLVSILNIFKYGTLLFQHISHRVLSWTLAPLSLLFLIPSGTVRVINERILSFGFYIIPLWLQVVLFVSALLGWYLENRSPEINTLYNTQYPEGVKFE